MALLDIQVPDIGDFDEVAVIELLVKPGDTIRAEQSLITVESDKASMEIPSSHAGVVKEVKVKLGDKVKQGSVVVVLEAAAAAPTAAAPTAAPTAPVAPAAPTLSQPAQVTNAGIPAAGTEEPVGQPAPTAPVPASAAPVQTPATQDGPYYIMTTNGPRLATKGTPGAYRINRPAANK